MDPGVSLPEEAWTRSTPWQRSAAARWWIAAGGGLGLLATLALTAGVALRLSEPLGQTSCGSPEECSDTAVSLARAPEASNEDLEQAAKLFRQACDEGHAEACNNLGLAHEAGQGVKQDYARAMSFFEKACSDGLAEACSNQGALFEHGLGVPVNLGDAQRLYAQACRRGSALGCSNLGVLYADGRGVEPNMETARRYFAEACQAGSEIGCSNLFESERPSSSP